MITEINTADRARVEVVAQGEGGMMYVAIIVTSSDILPEIATARGQRNLARNVARNVASVTAVRTQPTTVVLCVAETTLPVSVPRGIENQITRQKTRWWNQQRAGEYRARCRR